ADKKTNSVKKDGSRRKPKKASTGHLQPADRKHNISAEKPILPGDAVRLKEHQAVGSVLEVNDKQAVIAIGMIKTTVKLEQLEKVSKSLIKRESAKNISIQNINSTSIHEKKLNFKPDIDVRGMRGDEALQAVTYFIDDAIQLNNGRVRILHGTGNGILRQLIRQYLSSVAGIKHFGDEHVQFGGAGITVVDLE
ncbi:MAG: Smr/MutS family protein, partial [Tannerella sp.]|nr:Smr/MutS family protein [Tannerella sp.]